jgi:hypothetical protein
MIEILDLLGRISNLLMTLFFLTIVINSLWSWLLSVIEDRKSIPNNRIKDKNTQMD